MTTPPDNNLDDTIRQLRDGLGQRRESIDEQPPLRDAEPIYGQAQPISQQPQMVRLSLPSYRPLFWRWLLALNVALYLVEVVLSGGLDPSYDVLDLLGAKNNLRILINGEYWRLLTAMFLHGSVLHILFNGFALFSFGPEAEGMFGSARFLAVYFIGGLAGSVASYAFSPALSVGASGAIFALLGALTAFYYENRKTLGEGARQQLGGLITIAVLNLLIGFSPGTNIDNFGHIGGLVGGLLVGWLLAPRFEIDARLYPPVVVRRFLSYGWAGSLAVLVLMVVLVVIVIRPPL